MDTRIKLREPSLFNQPITTSQGVFFKLLSSSEKYSQENRSHTRKQGALAWGGWRRRNDTLEVLKGRLVEDGFPFYEVAGPPLA